MPDPERRRVGFLVHELLECLLALIFGEVALHEGGATRLLAISMALSLVVLNLASDGPLGLSKALKRQVHRFFDLGLGASFAIGAVVFWHRLGLAGVSLGIIGGAAVIALSQASSYKARVRVGWRPREGASLEVLAPLAGHAARTSIRGLGRLSGTAARQFRSRSAQRGAPPSS